VSLAQKLGTKRLFPQHPEGGFNGKNGQITILIYVELKPHTISGMLFQKKIVVSLPVKFG
jgi:hypothetical protein